MRCERPILELLMKKQYKVANTKKSERLFKKASSVTELLDVYRAHGEKTFFVWKEQNEQKEITYPEFADYVYRYAAGLKELFGENPVRIAVIGENSPYWVASYLAVMLSGNVVVPMDKELSKDEILKFAEYADVAAFAHSESFSDFFEERVVKEGHPTIKYLIPFTCSCAGADGQDDAVTSAGSCDKNEGKARVIDISSVAAFGEGKNNLNEPADPDECCELLFTSGTTGSSKCVMLSSRNIFSDIMSACATVDFYPDDVLVSVLPLHHTYELMCTVAASCYGTKICVCPALRYAMKAFKEYQPTALILVPLFVSTMYKRVLSEAKKAGKDKALLAASKLSHALNFVRINTSELFFKDVRDAFGGNLKKIICGGAALAPELITAFDSFGIAIYEGYGITECSPLVAVTPYYKRKPGSVGLPVPCCEVKIQGENIGESGNITGEVLVKGTNVMLGYMNNDEANAEVFDEDGWFHTGDVGYLDEDGYLYITGRQKSVIVLENGKNVFPEEIEEYLYKFDEISETVVIGREDEESVVLTAVIIPAYDKFPETNESELKSIIQKKVTALNKSLPSFKQIHKIEFRKAEFEKTTTNKIKRYLVK